VGGSEIVDPEKLALYLPRVKKNTEAVAFIHHVGILLAQL
jgi:hypothetical protein